MILSEDRQSHLAHMIIDGLWKDDIVEYSNEDGALRAAKQGVANFVDEVEEIYSLVQKKIGSLKRGVVEGSPEWDILYSKYMEEELKKRDSF